jgi:LPXTG-motif cell wall-anchored protein
MRSRLAAALAAMVGLMAAGLVAVAAPAAATETQPEPVCEATWKMRGWDGTAWTGKPSGAWITRTKVKLVKPQAANENVQPGVEFAAFDLDIQAPAETEILVGVKYELGNGATVTSGAVRLFGYKAQNADTESVAPDYGPAVATSETGSTLVLTIPAGEKLGTLGLVYDGSNSSKGWVKFRQMTIGQRPVWFTACPEPEPTASATPTAAPTQTATPTTGPTQTATPKPQDCQAYLYTGTQENLCKDFPGDQGSVTCADVEYRVTLVNKSDDPWGLDGSGGNIGTVGVGCESNPLKPTGSAAPVPAGLPVTGSTPWMFALAGLCALGAGGLLYWLSRRRSVQFRA